MRRIVHQNQPLHFQGALFYGPPRMTLPKDLDEVEYSLSIGDGTNRKPCLVRIDTKYSKFRGEKLSQASAFIRRKIENLFILSYASEPMQVIFN